MIATGPIATFGAINAGAGYANGTYPNVALGAGHGSGALATLTVAGGGVTAVAFSNPSPHQQLDRTGKNYQVGDILAALPSFDGVGSGAGFTVTVASLAKACENCFYGKIVPLSAPASVAGLRFCGNDAFRNNQQPLAFQPNNVNTWLANITADDYFCGDGLDAISLASFSSGATGLPSTGYPGVTGIVTPDNGVASFSFNLPGNFTKFFISPANNNAATFTRLHGAWMQSLDPGVSVEISSADATTFSGAQTWYYEALP
jgi:hypothetical protein